MVNSFHDERPRSQASAKPYDLDAVRHVVELMEDSKPEAVFDYVADLHPADVARLLIHTPFDIARRLFQGLSLERAAETLTELDDDFRKRLLEAMVPGKIKAMLDG